MSDTNGKGAEPLRKDTTGDGIVAEPDRLAAHTTGQQDPATESSGKDSAVATDRATDGLAGDGPDLTKGIIGDFDALMAEHARRLRPQVDETLLLAFFDGAADGSSPDDKARVQSGDGGTPPGDGVSKTADAGVRPETFKANYPVVSSQPFQQELGADLARTVESWPSMIDRIDTAQRFEILRQKLEILQQAAQRSEIGQRFYDPSLKPSAQFQDMVDRYGGETDRSRGELSETLNRRVAELETSFNNVLKKHGLPPVKIVSTLEISGSKPARDSGYQGGAGTINLSSDLLLSGRPPAEVQTALMREYVFNLQDRLVMTDAVDDVAAGKSRYTGDQARRLEYRERTGTDKLLPQEGQFNLTGREIESAVFNELPEATRSRLNGGNPDKLREGTIFSGDRLNGKSLTAEEYNALEPWQRKLLTGRNADREVLESVASDYTEAKKTAGDKPVLSEADKQRAREFAKAMTEFDGELRKIDRLTQMDTTCREVKATLGIDGGIELVLKRLTSDAAFSQRVFGGKPVPAEIASLMSDFQGAGTRNGALDPRKWTPEKSQEFKRKMETLVAERSTTIQTELGRSVAATLTNPLSAEASAGFAPAPAPKSTGRDVFDAKQPKNPLLEAIGRTDFSDFYNQSAQRTALSMEYSWSVPNRAALATIYDFAAGEGIVEVGSGKGYWANMLRQMGMDVVAYDTNPLDAGTNQYQSGQAFTQVLSGDTAEAGKHPGRALMLCWPPPDDPMAAEALKAYTEAGGKKLVFIGERPLPTAHDHEVVTGDRAFHRTLDKDWVLRETVDLPHMPNGNGETGDRLYVYEKRGETAVKADAPIVDAGSKVTFQMNDAMIVKALPGEKVLLYQPARQTHPTGGPKPDAEKLRREYERIEVTGFDGKPVEHAEYYKYKATGDLFKIEANMIFPAEELVVADSKDVRPANDYGPQREVSRTSTTKSVDGAFTEGRRRYSNTPFTTREFADGVEISNPSREASPAPAEKRAVDPPRDVRIYSADGGKTEIPLFRAGHWFHIADKHHGADGDVKAHITITSNADKAAIDRLLIPLLYDAINNTPGPEAEKLGLTGLLSGAKLKDPLDRDHRFRHFTFEPDLKYPGAEITDGAFTEKAGQGAKGYTFYGKTAGDIERAAAIIDKYLADNAKISPELILDKNVSTGNLGDLTKVGITNRISIARETWGFTETESGKYGAAIESDLGEKIRAQYGKEGKIDQAGLDKLCKDAGIRPGLLTLDRDGKVMMLATSKDQWLTNRGEHGDAVYLNEAAANRSFGELDGRHAMYSLYRHLNKDGSPESKDPAHYIALEERNARRAFLEIPLKGMTRDSADFKDLQALKVAVLDGDLKALNDKFRELTKAPDQARASRVMAALAGELEKHDMTVTWQTGQARDGSQSGTLELKGRLDRYRLSLSTEEDPKVLERTFSGDKPVPPLTDSESLDHMVKRNSNHLQRSVRYAPVDLAALQAIPESAQYRGDAGKTGVESLSTTTSRVDAAAEVVDRVLGSTGDKPAEPRFKNAPEEIKVDLAKLEKLIGLKQNKPHESYKYSAQEIRDLIRLMDRGYLEYFSPDNGKTIVKNMRMVIEHSKQLHGDVRTQTSEFDRPSRQLQSIEQAVKTFDASPGSTTDPEQAWKLAWLRNFSGSDEATAERVWKNSIELIRSNVGSQIPIDAVAEISRIQADLGLTGADGSKQAWEILKSARTIKERFPSASDTACMNAAQMLHLDSTAENPLKFGSSTALRLAQQAGELSNDLGSRDIYEVLRLKTDFIEVHKTLDKDRRKIDFSSAENEADVRKLVRNYVEDRATEAVVEEKLPADMLTKWDKLDSVFRIKADDPEAAKKELIARFLTRQIENYAVKEFLADIRTDRIDKMSADEMRKTLDMVTDSARTVVERLPLNSKERDAFLDTWRAAIEQFEASRKHVPSIRDERINNAMFEYVRQLTVAELKAHDKSYIEHWLKHTLTEKRLGSLDADGRADLILNFLVADEGASAKRKVPVAEYSRLIRSLDSDVVRAMDPVDQRWIRDITLRLLNDAARTEGVSDAPAQIQKSVDTIVDKVLGEHISDSTAKELLGYYKNSDLHIAMQIMQSRGQHMTIQGLNKQFDAIADHLRSNEYMSRIFVRGRPAERLRVVCVGNASEGEKLAYLMRKATGVQVDIYNVSDPSQLPEGKFLLLDKMPAGALGDAIKARTAKGTAYQPESIADFHNGINVFDLARAGLSGDDVKDVRSKLTDAITAAKRKYNDSATTTLNETAIGLSAKDMIRLREAIRFEIRNEIETMKTQGLLYLAKHAAGTGTTSVREAQTLGLVFEHGTNFVSYTDMMRDARTLYNEKLKGADPKKCYFVVDIDSQGSGRLATRLLREANGLTGPEWDNNFITKDQARDMAKRGELKGMKLIGLDDCIYSGKTADTIGEALISIAKDAKPGEAPKLVIATLRAFEEGMKSARSSVDAQVEKVKSGGLTAPEIQIEVGAADLIKDNRDTLRDNVNTKPIRRTLKEGVTTFFANLFKRSEWKDSTVSSRFVFPHMVPNNNSMRMNVFYRQYLGVAGAHSESRFDDPRFDKYSSSRVKGIDRFGYVNESIIRGGKPRNEAAVRQLAEHGVTTVINMEIGLDAEVAEWFKKYNIEVVHMPLEPSTMTAEQIEAVAKRVQESIGPDKKCFIHCTHGKDRTGTVIAHYRVTREGWKRDVALREMDDFGYTKKTRGLEHLQDLVADKTAIEQLLDNPREIGSDLYMPEKKDANELRDRYEKTKGELKLAVENPLRGDKAWQEYKKQIDALKEAWKSNYGETLPETLRYRSLALETYESLRDQVAAEIAKTHNIEFEEAARRVDASVEANPTGDTALRKAYRDFIAWNNEADRQFEQLRPRIDQRAREFQTAMNKFLESKGLPSMEVKWVQDLNHAHNLYLLGEGTVLVKYTDLLNTNNFDKMVERVYHEAGHHVQDMEIVRAIAQEVTREQAARGGENDPAKYRDLIKSRYADGQVLSPDKDTRASDFKLTLSDRVLDRVLESMKDKPEMTAGEIQRADLLAKSFRTNQAYREKFEASEHNFLVTDSIRYRLQSDPTNRTAEAVLEASLKPENGEFRKTLFGESEIEKLPPRVQEQLTKYKNARKGESGEALGFDGLTARTVLEANLNKRLLAINAERKSLEEAYLRPLHELEGQLLEAEATERRVAAQKAAATRPTRGAQPLPDGGDRRPGGQEPGAKPPLERPGTDDLLKSSGERPGGEMPGGDRKPAVEEGKKTTDTTLDTSRRVADHASKDSASIVIESLALTTLYHAGKKGSHLGRTGLDKYFDRFFAHGQDMLRNLATTPEGRTEQLNAMLKKFVSQVDTLKENPLLKNATLVADKSIEGGGGKLVYMHGETAIDPMFTDAKSVHYRTPEGELKSVPLEEVRVELRVSEAALAEARSGTTTGKNRATEIVSTLFHQLHQIDQLRGREERAKMDGIDLRSDKGDPLARRQFLEKEKGQADIAADYMQYSLNDKSLDGKTRVHPKEIAYDLKKPISELTGERIVTAMGPDGRMKIYVLDKNKTVTEVESERSERLVKEGFAKLVERCDEKIKEAERAKDEKLVEKLRAERARILADQKAYETDPAFRKNVNHELTKHAGKFRRGAGIAVTVLFLTTVALEAFRQESHGSDLNLDIPITGS